MYKECMYVSGVDYSLPGNPAHKRCLSRTYVYTHLYIISRACNTLACNDIK